MRQRSSDPDRPRVHARWSARASAPSSNASTTRAPVALAGARAWRQSPRPWCVCLPFSISFCQQNARAIVLIMALSIRRRGGAQVFGRPSGARTSFRPRPTPLLPRSGFVKCAGCPRPALSPPFIAAIGQDGWPIILSAKPKRLILTFRIQQSGKCQFVTHREKTSMNKHDEARRAFLIGAADGAGASRARVWCLRRSPRHTSSTRRQTPQPRLRNRMRMVRGMAPSSTTTMLPRLRRSPSGLCPAHRASQGRGTRACSIISIWRSPGPTKTYRISTGAGWPR